MIKRVFILAVSILTLVYLPYNIGQLDFKYWGLTKDLVFGGPSKFDLWMCGLMFLLCGITAIAVVGAIVYGIYDFIVNGGNDD